MPDIITRPATEADEQSLLRICLLTADAGASAEYRHNYGELPGLVYAVPYVKLPSTFGFVMEVLETKEVVGYVLSSFNTRVYEQAAAETWWPTLKASFPLPANNEPGYYDKELKEGDKAYIERIWDMHTAPEANIKFSAAHLHIDILEDYQRQGWGRKLIAEVVRFLGERGLDGVWVGLDTRNDNAKKFYAKLGFKDIEGAPDGNMGLKFKDFGSG
ncbi:hypothetical protein PLEOSDRAFT_1076097 [Pleurotus ostreatus PC15]|uniref:N-acetyltransferase domain-containing protein n=1 Tax=Pleurotus ostreatus (strain PC15) TaxID=1137138 RepID=A0A067NMP8_PLEO1|nr:hypothetical protein PLEOSDRAFT_1076097 [Pleurotus ostreatus PC15]